MTTYTLNGYKVSSDDEGNFTGISATTLEFVTEDVLSTLRYQWFDQNDPTDTEAVFDDTGAIWNIFVDGEKTPMTSFSKGRTSSAGAAPRSSMRCWTMASALAA